MQKALRIIAMVILLITAANAFVAGCLFIIHPSGNALGMHTTMLKHSPFNNYLIPGIILLAVNGILPLLITGLSLFKWRHYPLAILLQGILLGGWIVVQVIMLRTINVLQITIFLFALSLFIIGLLLLLKGKHKSA